MRSGSGAPVTGGDGVVSRHGIRTSWMTDRDLEGEQNE
jgi:hypothetical protein